MIIVSVLSDPIFSFFSKIGDALLGLFGPDSIIQIFVLLHVDGLFLDIFQGQNLGQRIFRLYLGHNKVIVRLEIQPVIGRHVKKAGQAQGCISGNTASC